MTQGSTYAVEMRGVTRRFGEVLANDHIDLEVRSGSIHAIVGENGAGKSTAMNILYGFYTPDSGDILIEGHPRTISSPRDAIRLGLGMVHQHFMLVETLTVTENIILGAEPRSGLGAIDYNQARRRVEEISTRYGLRITPDARVSDLSVGQQQRVEIVKMLYRGARILILDEPTAVLTPQEVAELFNVLRGLRDQGKTIIIITHKLAEVLALSDDITVMRDGKVVGELKTAEATAEGLARLMVGREVLLRVEKKESEPGEAVLAVKSLNLRREGIRILDDISFEVRSREILGLAGVEGNGQTELVEVLAGLRRLTSGQVFLDGEAIEHLGVRERKRLGIAHIPEDRHRRGLVLSFDVASNSILGLHREPLVAGRVFLNRRKIDERARRLVQEYDVRPPNVALPARALSGGNQQKLIIAREFDINPRLLLVSQPTRGVDIGATEFIHRKLVEMRDRGAAVLLVTAELDEVISLSDRIIVIYEGRLVGEVDPRSVNEQEIGLMMTGGATVAGQGT